MKSDTQACVFQVLRVDHPIMLEVNTRSQSDADAIALGKEEALHYARKRMRSRFLCVLLIIAVFASIVLNTTASVSSHPIRVTQFAARVTSLAFYAESTPQPTNTPDPLQVASTFTGNNADWKTLYPQGYQHTFDDGITMVLVPAGTFTIGTNPQQADERNGQSIHFEVPFWIDLTELTQSDFLRLGGVAERGISFNFSQYPAGSVTWFEARDFCALRGARLPSEAEWEYAARGPSEWDYPWGDLWSPNNAVWNRDFQLHEHGSAEVGSIPAGRSWIGALDMSGNMWEWVTSIYGVETNDRYNFSDIGEKLYRYPYHADDGRETDSEDRMHIRGLRGGSWAINYSILLRAGNRYAYYPDSSLSSIGFRCARSS